MATPTWQAARNGLTGDSNAVDKSAQINQLLGAHGVTLIYRGSQIVTPDGLGFGTDDPADFWGFSTDQFDFDQPFTMSGTNLGRILVPILPVGDGADLIVSLCADSAGTPGTVLSTTFIPKEWINAFAAYSAVGSPSTTADVFIETTNSPLATAQHNTMQCGSWREIAWTSPAVGVAGGAGNPTITYSGNFILSFGGFTGTATPINSVFTIEYPGSGFDLGNTIPQPVLPVSTAYISAAVTETEVVVAGGLTGSSLGTIVNTVYVAPWDSSTGVIGAWAQQTALPTNICYAGMAASGENVYIAAGTTDNTATITNAVYWTTVTNGQIASWNAGPSLPVALYQPTALVVGSWLMVIGGYNTFGGPSPQGNVYYAPILSDGSLGSWQTVVSPMPVPVSSIAGGSTFANGSGFIKVGGFTNVSGTDTAAVQTMTIDENGPSANGLAPWNQQTCGISALNTPGVAFTVGTGQSHLFSLFGPAYFSVAVYGVPYISIPLVASGLTNGTTYHILLQQQGGSTNNYLRTTVDHEALPGNPTLIYRARGSSGSWTTFATTYGIPIAMFNQAVTGPVLHTWEDSGAKISTILHSSTPDQRIIGIADCTQFADGTVTSTVTQVNYEGTWPINVWPPLSATQLS